MLLKFVADKPSDVSAGTLYVPPQPSIIVSFICHTPHAAVLLKFVADKPSDLSAGTLYAAKLSNQRTDGAGKPTWTVTWTKLGYGESDLLNWGRRGTEEGHGGGVCYATAFVRLRQWGAFLMNLSGRRACVW